MFLSIKRKLQKWLLSDIEKRIEGEQAAQWQSIWDLRECIIRIQENGLDTRIKEIDFADQRFYNSHEKRMTGSRIVMGFINKYGEGFVCGDKAKELGIPIEKIPEFWEDMNSQDKRKFFKK